MTGYKPGRAGLALFDFDGTITDRDSFFDFIRFVHPTPRVLWGLLCVTPAVLGMALGLLPRQQAKERVMREFFGRMALDDFNRHCADYAAQRIPDLLRAGALQRIQQHQDAGDRVIVISASPENWIAPWCAAHSLELLATPLQVLDGTITGRVDGANCRGPEKLRRLQAYLDTSAYAVIHAYGDSDGDREMLALADEAHYRPFR